MSYLRGLWLLGKRNLRRPGLRLRLFRLNLLCPALARDRKDGNQHAGKKSTNTQQRKSSTA
jgi:hypothetical protein